MRKGPVDQPASLGACHLSIKFLFIRNIPSGDSSSFPGHVPEWAERPAFERKGRSQGGERKRVEMWVIFYPEEKLHGGSGQPADHRRALGVLGTRKWKGWKGRRRKVAWRPWGCVGGSIHHPVGIQGWFSWPGSDSLLHSPSGTSLPKL